MLTKLSEQLKQAIEEVGDGKDVPEATVFYRGLAQWQRDRAKSVASLTGGLAGQDTITRAQEVALSEFVERVSSGGLLLANFEKDLEAFGAEKNRLELVLKESKERLGAAKDAMERNRFATLISKIETLAEVGKLPKDAQVRQLAAENDRLRNRVARGGSRKPEANSGANSPNAINLKAISEREVEAWLAANPEFIERKMSTVAAMQQHHQQFNSPATKSLGRPRMSDSAKGAHSPGLYNINANVDPNSPDIVRSRRREVLMSLAETVFLSLETTTLIRTIMESARTLMNAERCSLFLVDRETKELYTSISGEMEEVRIPISSGIAGYVATTGETLNIPDAYKDKRFNPEIDQKTGFKTKSILCMPIKAYSGEIVGVAQLVNKQTAPVFDTDDENLFLEFSVYCGISLGNARLYETALQKERDLQDTLDALELASRKNELVLSLAETINTELNIPALVQKIVDASREITNADRCALFRFDRLRGDLEVMYMPGVDPANAKKMRISLTTSIAGYVATSGFTVNVPDAYADPRFNKEIDKVTGYETRTILCMPIFDAGREVIAVIQLLNKKQDENEGAAAGLPALEAGSDAANNNNNNNNNNNTPGKPPRVASGKQRGTPNGTAEKPSTAVPRVQTSSGSTGFNVPQFTHNHHGYQHEPTMLDIDIKSVTWPVFTQQDENVFESFAIFAGIALRNADLYHRALHNEKKTMVALELISYHSSCSKEEMTRTFENPLSRKMLEDSRDYDFTLHTLDQDTLCKLVFEWFVDLGLVTRFHIPEEKLKRLIVTLRKNYRPVPYHNYIHAVVVTHTMYTYCVHTVMRETFDDITLLGMMVACLCHDVDHRGTNNDFQVNTNSPLAHIYGSSSVMENHHWDRTVTILSSPDHNIFTNLSGEEFDRVFKILKARILDTDLSLHFGMKARLIKLIEDGQLNKKDPEHQELIASVIMTCCDISSITKPFADCEHWANIVCQEFFAQGDLEKALGRAPVAMLDRAKTKIPPMQVGFLDFVGKPAYALLARIYPKVQHQVDMLQKNRDIWKARADEEAKQNAPPA